MEYDNFGAKIQSREVLSDKSEIWDFLSFIFYRGVDVENAIKLAAADDGYVTYDELRENLRK